MDRELKLVLNEVAKDRKQDAIREFKEKVANGKIPEKSIEKEWEKLKDKLGLQ